MALNIVGIAGFAAVTRDPAASESLYRDTLGLPLSERDGYLWVDNFEGARHFGVWPLSMAAQSCFGTDNWPDDVPVPHATIEFEMRDAHRSAQRSKK